jgi:hypothetical protein
MKERKIWHPKDTVHVPEQSELNLSKKISKSASDDISERILLLERWIVEMAR